MTEAENNKKLLGALLLEKGLIAQSQLQNALESQKREGSHLGYWLIRLGFMSVEKLSGFLSENQSIGRVSTGTAAGAKACRAVPRSLALYYKMAPLQLEGRLLTVALADVSQPHLVGLLSEITGHQIDALILPEQEIRSLIERGYQVPTEHGVEFSPLDDNAFIITDARKGIKALTPVQLKNVGDVGERLRSMIAEAIKEKVREILIKPEADRADVYFKKDSLKHSDFTLNQAQHDDITFLIFRLAGMNPIQQKMPQHGRLSVKINDRKILMLVSAVPTIYGIRFMLEMFDEKVLKHSYEELLTPFPDVRKNVEDFLMEGKKGMLVITGPEGSGRTHLLYSLLSKAKGIYKNIHTLENSIRYPINGIRQNEMSEDRMTRALEDYLSQPPDLVAVSVLKNIRAVEVAFLLAARIPVIMILSSYDAFKAVEWLCGHNLKSPLKAGLLHTVVSPRIIPRVCPHCSVPYDGQEEEIAGLNLPSGALLKMNQGCDHCRQKENVQSETFFESFRIDQEAIEWILKDHSSTHLIRSARSAGRHTLYDLVIGDAFSDHLDMLSVAKLQAAQ